MFLNSSLFKYHKIPFIALLLSLVLYFSFAYNLLRTEALKLILLYTALFTTAYVLKKSAGFNFGFLVLASVLVRLIFLPVIPNLSQDFYRFIWDGQMSLIGFNPYLTTPDFQMEMGMLSNFPNQVELHNGMGQLSAKHYTNYPPINQLCFIIANLFPGKSILSSVIGMRLIIIAADLGTLYFGKKLLDRLRLPSSRIWWYILNPFIIIELTGNLHFEGVMIFFLVWSLYLLHSGKWKLAAIVLGCSISVKLIPLMFLPLFFWWFRKSKEKNQKLNNEILNRVQNDKNYSLFSIDLKKLILFYLIVGFTTVALFLPFFSIEFINNYAQTVGLWFNNFEFNASIYYLAREIGYAFTGYNEIKIIGKILPVLALTIILGFSFFKKNNTIPKLTTAILLAFTCYLFLSTTVHPWYIATLVILCVFTNYRFPLVWSLAIIISYLAYLSIGSADKSENLWVIAIEYIIVFSAFIWEVFLKKKINL